jgi:DNA repair protein RecO (recombination protein O)
VVLKRRDFQESSRIAVVYTRAAGKVQLLARGARQRRNKHGAALEPLSRGEFVFYWREGKDLFTLAETTVLHSGRFIRESPRDLPYGLAMAESLDRLSAEGDPDEALFELLAGSLNELDRGGPGPALLTHFLLGLAVHLGLKPDLDVCAVCGRPAPKDGVAFSPAEGSIVCRECDRSAGQSLVIPARTYNYVKALLSYDVSRVARIKAGPELVEGALSFIRAHLAYQSGLKIKSLSLTFPPQIQNNKGVI